MIVSSWRAEDLQRGDLPYLSMAIVCINQDDVEERNHQVDLMRLIFTRCEYAFSWLGKADEDSDLAMTV